MFTELSFLSLESNSFLLNFSVFCQLNEYQAPIQVLKYCMENVKLFKVTNFTVEF